MRNFGIVDQKLEEADFFCDLVAEGGADYFKVRYYFSAYVAAARSVTFALQASISDAEGFVQWYGPWQDRLRKDPLAKFFHACRTDTQHVGLNPVRFCTSVKGHGACYFGQPELGRYKWLPEEDVATSCREHMKLLCVLIQDCYRVFAMLIDPDQIYTLQGMRSKGWTVDDVAVQLGFPRGWTDYFPDVPDREAHTLRVLRRQIPMSCIGPLLAKYLDDPLSKQ